MRMLRQVRGAIMIADMEPSFNRRADELIINGRYAEAQAFLEAAIQAMPGDWTPIREDDRLLSIAFWDQEESLAHSHYVIESKQLTKSIAWVDGSYSRSWYQLAVVEKAGAVRAGALLYWLWPPTRAGPSRTME
jgi:hypothetical protein